MNTLIALLQALAEVAPLIRLIMEKNMAKDKELQDAKDNLLKEWKDAYASHDISAITDALRRLRTSK